MKIPERYIGKKSIDLRSVTNIWLARTPDGQVGMVLEAKHDRDKKPRVLECYMTPEQAIEIGTAIQRAAEQVHRNQPIDPSSSPPSHSH